MTLAILYKVPKDDLFLQYLTQKDLLVLSIQLPPIINKGLHDGLAPASRYGLQEKQEPLAASIIMYQTLPLAL